MLKDLLKTWIVCLPLPLPDGVPLPVCRAARQVRVVHLLRHPIDLVLSQKKMGFNAKLANGTKIAPQDHLNSQCPCLYHRRLQPASVDTVYVAPSPTR